MPTDSEALQAQQMALPAPTANEVVSTNEVAATKEVVSDEHGANGVVVPTLLSPSTQEDDDAPEDEKKSKNPKKRGRKPKGGKIVVTSSLSQNVIISEPNIILHLKCGKSDLEKTAEPLSTLKYDPVVIENIENYQFDKNKGSELNFFVILEVKKTNF